jgi:hypothetical protein
MARYRVYFVNWNASIAGWDDFDAEDDAQAAVIARLLRHACSDRCAGFELWKGVRRVDTLLPKGFEIKELSARVQDIVTSWKGRHGHPTKSADRRQRQRPPKKHANPYSITSIGFGFEPRGEPLVLSSNRMRDWTGEIRSMLDA